MYLLDNKIIDNFNLNIIRIFSHTLDFSDGDRSFNKLDINDEMIDSFYNDLQTKDLIGSNNVLDQPLDKQSEESHLKALFDNFCNRELNGLTNLKYLTFKNKDMKEFTVLDSLIYLDLSSNNNLTELKSDVNNTLKTINLKDTSVPYEMLSKFKALENIEGFGSVLEEFEVLPITILSLKKLCCNTTFKISLEVWTSQISDNLEWLEIRTDSIIKDDIKKLKHLSIFCHKTSKILCPNLESLEMHADEFDLSKIEEYSSLKKLKLDGNGISTQVLKSDDISKFTNLECLEISDIKLESDFSFSTLINLKELYINTSLTYKANTFNGLSNLDKLHIKYGKLPEDSFKDLTNLRELKLSDCFDVRCEFVNLHLLKYLSIGNSEIKNNPDIFKNLFRLERLEFYNNITNINQKMFSDLLFLKSLEISKYHKVDELFVNLHNLFEITVWDRPLKNFNNFKNLISLRKVNLTITTEFDSVNQSKEFKLKYLKDVTDVKLALGYVSSSILSPLHHLKNLDLLCNYIERGH